MNNSSEDASSAVSVVTIVKEGNAPQVLRSLCAQSLEQPFEIIVATGGNRSEARNAGIVSSKASLVAFIDSDCEAPPDWLRKLTTTLPESTQFVGLGGVSLSKKPVTSLQAAIDGVFSTYLGNLGSPSLISVPKAHKKFVSSLSGHNCIYKKSALNGVGGFDTRFELNEDTDLASRLRAKGYSLVLDESIFVHHERRKSFAAFVRQFFHYGRGRMRSMLTTVRLLDFKILALLFALLLTAAAAFHTPIVALVGFAIYLLIVFWCSLRAAMRVGDAKILPLLISLLIVEHFAYAVGLLAGFFSGPWVKSKTEANHILLERHFVTHFDKTGEDLP
jgi:cellulose synthase/poly-beta-1,6-N-acetylglucosamine synthase-like glycosyltransferase